VSRLRVLFKPFGTEREAAVVYDTVADVQPFKNYVSSVIFGSEANVAEYEHIGFVGGDENQLAVVDILHGG